MDEKEITEPRYLKEYEAIINNAGIGEKLTPLAIFLDNCSVIAILCGIGDKPQDKELIGKIIHGELRYVIITPSYVKELSDDVKYKVENIIRCGVSSSKNLIDLGSLIFLVTSLALTDSINPCTLYLYLLLLVSASLISLSEKVSKRHVLGIGLSFIIAIMVGYIALGLGLLNFIKFIPRWGLSVIGIGFGIWIIASTLYKKERTIAKTRFLKMLPIASEKMFMSALLGLLASFTLLPCSAGPYIVFIGIISRLSFISSLMMLLYYNIIFVIPMLALLLAILVGISYTNVRDFIINNSTRLSILAGVLLIAIATYMVIY